MSDYKDSPVGIDEIVDNYKKAVEDVKKSIQPMGQDDLRTFAATTMVRFQLLEFSNLVLMEKVSNLMALDEVTEEDVRH